MIYKYVFLMIGVVYIHNNVINIHNKEIRCNNELKNGTDQVSVVVF